MGASSIRPTQTAYVGESWFVGFDFAGWVPSTITPVSNVATATNAAGEDKTGDVLSGALVSVSKSVVTFSGFVTAETYTVVIATTLSNGEIHKDAITIATDTL